MDLKEWAKERGYAVVVHSPTTGEIIAADVNKCGIKAIKSVLSLWVKWGVAIEIVASPKVKQYLIQHIANRQLKGE